MTGSLKRRSLYWLKIDHVILKNAGFYTCLGELRDEYYFEDTAELIVIGKYAIVT